MLQERKEGRVKGLMVREWAAVLLPVVGVASQGGDI